MLAPAELIAALPLTRCLMEELNPICTPAEPFKLLLCFSSLRNFFIRRFRNYSYFTRFLILVLCMQFISWFIIAPDPRFVYGGLLCGSFLLATSFLKNQFYGFHKSYTRFSIILFAMMVFLYGTVKILKDKNYQNFLLPYQVPQPPVQQIVVDNIILQIPLKILNNWNPRCYATDLPCLYYINPKLRARGKTIKDGFRLEK